MLSVLLDPLVVVYYGLLERIVGYIPLGVDVDLALRVVLAEKIRPPELR